MKLEEYKEQMKDALTKLDWHAPGDRTSEAYQLLSRAATDREVPTSEWVQLQEQYREGVKRL